MSGYTPVFDSVFHGTLCGRWPTLPVWMTILPLADKQGHIDMTYQAISALTGWPLDLLRQAIGELMEPDPDSRTSADEGRRLVLIDPENRQWGWRVVNHGQYRERARKQMQQLQATESGRDAERKRVDRERQRLDAPDVQSRPVVSSLVQSRPATSSPVRLSDSDSDADSEKNSGGDSEDRISRPPKRTREPPGYERKEFHEAVIGAYHQALPDLPPVKAWSKHRIGALNSRIRERLRQGKPADTLEYWQKLFAQVAASDFLCGRGGEFRADLEWLLGPENFLKVIEGRYANRAGGRAHAA